MLRHVLRLLDLNRLRLAREHRPVRGDLAVAEVGGLRRGRGRRDVHRGLLLGVNDLFLETAAVVRGRGLGVNGRRGRISGGRALGLVNGHLLLVVLLPVVVDGAGWALGGRRVHGVRGDAVGGRVRLARIHF